MNKDWVIVLKDGTVFTGRRTWGCFWIEPMWGRNYIVVSGNNLPVGSEITVAISSINYRYRKPDITGANR